MSDRNASEAMALGINALREVCGRCPAVLDEPEMLGLVRDLAAYSKHRDKSVVAARGWINIVREHHPQLLQKKDRGRDKARSKATPLSFGADTATAQVPGEDLLRLYERGQLPEEFEDVVEQCNDLEGGGDGWVDVSDGEEDGAAAADNDKDGWEDADSGSDDEEDEDGWVDVDQGSDSDAESDAGSDDGRRRGRRRGRSARGAYLVGRGLCAHQTAQGAGRRAQRHGFQSRFVVRAPTSSPKP